MVEGTFLLSKVAMEGAKQAVYKTMVVWVVYSEDDSSKKYSKINANNSNFERNGGSLGNVQLQDAKAGPLPLPLILLVRTCN